VKAGDVITSINGERIRTSVSFAENFPGSAMKRTDGKVGVLRNKNEISLSVELPAPAARTKHVFLSPHQHLANAVVLGPSLCRGPFIGFSLTNTSHHFRP